jgi:hypothetical protein
MDQLPWHSPDTDADLRAALDLYHGLLVLVDRVECSTDIPVSVKWVIYENLFLLLCLDLIDDDTEHVPAFSELASLYVRVEKRYRRVIEECFTGMMTGLLQYLGKGGRCADWSDLMTYCHYEAGLPGLCVLRLLCEAGLEDNRLATTLRHEMNSLGTFLQLTENVCIPARFSVIPPDVIDDQESLFEAMDRMVGEGGRVAARVRSGLGKRLIVEPFLAALDHYSRVVRSGAVKRRWQYDLVAVSVFVLIAGLLINYYYCYYYYHYYLRQERQMHWIRRLVRDWLGVQW